MVFTGLGREEESGRSSSLLMQFKILEFGILQSELTNLLSVTSKAQLVSEDG